MNIAELLQILQDTTNTLNGKDIREKSAIELIRDAISQIPEISSPLFLEDFRLLYATEHFGDIPVIRFQVHYPADKRTCDGLGYQIRNIEVSLIRNLPLSLDLALLNQQLEHDIALERKLEAEQQIKALKLQIATEEALISDLLPLA